MMKEKFRKLRLLETLKPSKLLLTVLVFLKINFRNIERRWWKINDEVGFTERSCQRKQRPNAEMEHCEDRKDSKYETKPDK